MAETNPNGHHAPEVDYDRRQERAGLIAVISTAMIVLLVGMILGVYWLYTVAYEKVEYDQYTGVYSKELRAIQEREEEQLHRYAYIDKEKGVVRIPIDRAMELLAAEYKEGKVSYNTKTYPLKAENPAGGATTPVTSAPADASKK
jgi:hypothetical protein